MADKPLPGTFALPSIEQYQAGLRAQAAKPGGWAGGLQASIFDLTRGPMGYKTPEEKKIQAASSIMKDATQRAAAVATDPLKQRQAVLTDVIQSFNALGMTDLVAQAMPELSQLNQQLEEMRKLGGEADSARLKANREVLTFADDIAEPGLKNAGTRASTDASIASAAESRADTRLKTQEANAGKPQTWYFPDKKGYEAVDIRDPASIQAAVRRGGFPSNADTTVDDPSKLGKQTKNKLNDALLASQNSLASLKNVSAGFDPSFLQIPSQLAFGGMKAAERLGVTLPAEMGVSLGKYSGFQRNAIEGLNTYIHDMTGAAMTNAEVPRLRKGYPDPEHDSPTVFVSKYRETVRAVLGIQKRAQLALNAGLDLTPEQLSAMAPAVVTDAELNEVLGPMASPSASGTPAAPGSAAERAQRLGIK